MLSYGKAMKELLEDFKTIFKKDRGLIGWMVAQLFAATWLFLLALFNLNPSQPKVWAQYSDINSGYTEYNWWYLWAFAILAVALGAGHVLISMRFYKKRGGDTARLFLGVGTVMALVAVRFLMNILGEG